MSFTAGDFLHVVSRENDQDWYEACNPLRNERGLVPVNHFETVGKTVRDSGDSSQSLTSTTHDSGYGEGATPPSQITSAPRMSANGAHSMASHRPSKSLSKVPGGVYGIVSYDFHAERPDELDAKEGEAIIVIAQSNPEWFVAKPITRLGGPGLIPVSFIEIRDMTTGQAATDPLAAVQKAGIPRVEEWKKMAAEYKNTSIPLGTVSSSQQVQGLQQGMDRMSMNSSQQSSYGHQRHQSSSLHSQQHQNLLAPVRASVPRYIYSDDKFHFIVECRLSDGAHWDLSRIYEDFYELQINLINAFPEEAGQVPNKPRILPYMPGPVKFVTDNISEGRRVNLDEYLRDLLLLPQAITTSSLVRNFFAPRDGDFEVDPNAVDLNEHARPIEPRDRFSQVSQSSYGMSSQHQHQQSQSRQPSSTSGSTHNYNPSQSSAITTHHRAQPSHASASFAQPPNQHTPPIPSGSTGAQLKIKCWFDRDTCVVIRMPPAGSFNVDELWRKVLERRRLEFKDRAPDDEARLDMEYRDESTGDYYRIAGDEDFNIAVAAHPEKLTIAVRDPNVEQ